MEHLFTAIQGFGAGAIVMAYVCGYNLSQLPIAALCLFVSVISRLGSK